MVRSQVQGTLNCFAPDTLPFNFIVKKNIIIMNTSLYGPFTEKYFELGIVIAAGRKAVFDSLTTSAGLCKWLLGDAVFTYRENDEDENVEEEKDDKTNDTEEKKYTDTYKEDKKEFYDNTWQVRDKYEEEEDPANIRREITEQIQKGDKYEWDWLHRPKFLSGKVLEIVPLEKVHLMFGNIFNILFEIEETGDRRIRIYFKQSFNKGYYDYENRSTYSEYHVFWGFFLTNLKSVLENNIDLRETAEQNDMLVNR